MRNSKKNRNQNIESEMPSTLYKYGDSRRINVLENQTIRFTQPQFLNDPFEVRPLFRNMFSGETINEFLDNGLNELINQAMLSSPSQAADKNGQEIARILISDKIKLIRDDFHKLMNNVYPNIERSVYEASKGKIAILSLTEDRNNLLMWSHYGDQHKGFVIGFDAKHDFINNSSEVSSHMRTPQKVFYSPQRPSITGGFEDIEASQIIKKMFLTKSAEWKYEKEWRVIRPQEVACDHIDLGEERILLYKAPHDSIKEIIIGARASDETKRSVLLTVMKNESLHHVKIFRAVTSFNKFGLDFIEIDINSNANDIVRDLYSIHTDRSFENALKEYADIFEKKTGFRIA